jgi:hypothetical protein
MSSVTDPLYVVALNYGAYLEWCERKRVQPQGAGFIYVRDVSRLLRVRDVRILFLYGWTERKDWREIHNRALIVGRRPQ